VLELKTFALADRTKAESDDPPGVGANTEEHRWATTWPILARKRYESKRRSI